MKITKVNLQSGHTGLKEVQMDGLGDLVILAGKNGSGKTRLLRAIETFGRAKLTPDANFQIEQQLSSTRANIAHFEQQRLQAEALPPDAPNREGQIQNFTNNIASHTQNEQNLLKQQAEATVLNTDNNGVPSVVYYKAQREALRDWKSIRRDELTGLTQNLKSEFNINLVSEAGISAIHELINSYVYASNPETTLTELQKEELKENLERLRTLIRQFLGTELTWDHQGDPHLFGAPIASANLSEGQKVLLQIALSLFFQDGTREDLVLLLDEPENHLHPLALIQLVDEIRRACHHAQVWIATHSVSLIAHYDPSLLWLVDDGEVIRAGSKSIEVLDALLGYETGVEELTTLLALPARHAAVHFAAQCLLPPLVADTPTGDPQTLQIASIVRSLVSSGDSLRIMDLGAGTGRLIGELEPFLGADKSVEYWAWDIEGAVGSGKCKERLQQIYGTQPRYRQGDESLEDLAGTIDLVVMCNSLHEIPPNNWPGVFGAMGMIAKMLRPDGYVLIVEDQLLGFGERAHDSGFHVLDSEQLRVLFQLDKSDVRMRTITHNDPRYTDRLKAHLIPANVTANVMRQSVVSTLKALRDSSLEEAKRLSRQSPSHRNARRLAFWTHQHLNAVLALELLADMEWTQTNLAQTVPA